jgi:hypothetical protein
MTQTELAPSPGAAHRLLAAAPFLLMLLFAFFGVAYTSVSRHAMSLYWMLLVPVFGIVCVAVAWRDMPAETRLREAVLQALHWSAVMLAMRLALIADMEKAMSAEASALVLLVVLALGAATAGLHLRAWPVVLVGAVLAAGVPIFAWLEERTLLIALSLLAVAALAGMFFALRHRLGTASAAKKAAAPDVLG